jgi:hypothetical protein
MEHVFFILAKYEKNKKKNLIHDMFLQKQCYLIRAYILLKVSNHFNISKFRDFILKSKVFTKNNVKHNFENQKLGVLRTRYGPIAVKRTI